MKSPLLPTPFYPISNGEQDLFFMTIKERLSHPTFLFNELHILEFYAFIIVTEGNYRHFLEFNIYHLTVGDLIIICPNQLHKFMDIKGFDGYILAFTEAFITDYLLNTNNLIRFEIMNKIYEFGKIKLSDFTFNQIKALVMLLRNELDQKTDSSQTLILQHLLSAVIININREINLLQGTIKFDNYTTIVMNFKMLLQEKMKHSFDVQYYADQLKVNKRTLQLATKKILNTTPKNLIDHALILQCKRALLDPAVQIQDVAFDLGFADAPIFTKYFKRQTNLTPQEFRKQFTE